MTDDRDDDSDDEAEVPEEIVLPITEELDLHPFAPADVPGVVADYIEAARERGFTVVRIVHGRGLGVQRAVVQRLLRDLPHVLSYEDAAPSSGGWGATIVRLSAR